MATTSRPTRDRARKSQRPLSRKDRRVRLRDYTLRLMRSARLPAFLLSVGLSVLLGAFALTDDFAVDTVIIRGNSLAYADSIVESSGALGESIFRIDTEEVAKRVASHPAVESADVRAQLPDRVIVSVVEREPSIVWQTGERAVLVDEYGWVLAEGDAENLPRVIELSGQVPNPGERVAVEMVVTAQSLLQEFGSTMTLEYEEGEGIAVHLPGDQVIVIGSPDELPVKLKVVSAVQALEADWNLLDVRDPDRPYYQ